MSELIIKSGQEKLFERMKKAGCFKQYASYQEWCKKSNLPKMDLRRRAINQQLYPLEKK